MLTEIFFLIKLGHLEAQMTSCICVASGEIDTEISIFLPFGQGTGEETIKFHNLRLGK